MLRHFLVLAVIVAGTGCKVPRMMTPADLGPVADEIAITSRSRASGTFANETFGMGAYPVTRVHRGGTSTKSSGFKLAGLGKESSSSQAFYDYDMTSPVGVFKGSCSVRTSSESTQIGNWVVGLGLAGPRLQLQRGRARRHAGLSGAGAPDPRRPRPSQRRSRPAPASDRRGWGHHVLPAGRLRGGGPGGGHAASAPSRQCTPGASDQSRARRRREGRSRLSVRRALALPHARRRPLVFPPPLDLAGLTR